ncbi:phage tail fiber protein [Serratia sp. IR-2025]|uniref:phage tail fiber protein n=1 Tax=Serratia marcescens TaxID=615 RepID=UPI00402B78A9
MPALARNDILGYDEGMPIDIPTGRWIDLRVEMPVSEVDEAPEAVEETAVLENVNVDPI